jgi:hypothetical protein
VGGDDAERGECRAEEDRARRLNAMMSSKETMTNVTPEAPSRSGSVAGSSESPERDRETCSDAPPVAR